MSPAARATAAALLLASATLPVLSRQFLGRTGAEIPIFMHGVDALEEARLLGHRCHNPLCQRIAPEHVVVSTARKNRQEWAVQRRLPYSPLADPRGPRRRARELRDLAREDPQLVADDLARLQELLGEQLTLW